MRAKPTVAQMLVTANTKTTGSAVVRNLKNRQTVQQAMTSSEPLCESDAEWIVEDFLISERSPSSRASKQLTRARAGKVRVPMANFNTITFTNVLAAQANGAIVGPGNATIIEMRQNGTQFTTTTVTSNSVSVKYAL